MMAAWHGSRTAGLLITLAVAAVLSGCSSSNVAQSAPGLRCTNYALQGTGQYHNEVSVKVTVTNSTTQAARYLVRVDLNPSSDASASASSANVTITGSVASRRSAVLARRVLTADPVQACRVAKIVRLGQS